MSQTARWGAVLCVFVGSLILLCWSAGAAAIATPYVDPVAKIEAQDEAIYGAMSFEMAAHGDWLTPRFVGRWYLTKPPLLNWLQAAWAKASRPGVWALRAPSLIAGAGTAALVFAWLLFEIDNLAGALVGAVLLLSSHLFFTMSRMGLTDAMLMFWTTLAVFALARSPRLDSASAVWTFGIASGGALMTKGVAGLFALIVLGAFCMISRERPAWARLVQAAAISIAVAAPWHLYQLAVHSRWFWTEYVMNEVVSRGLGAPPQATTESQIGFYVKRLVLFDAPLLAAAVFSLARKRPRVVLVWILVISAAALAFKHRSASYLLPAYPAMAILAAGAVPVSRAKWALVLAGALFVAKSLAPAQPWGIPWQPEVVNPSDTALSNYAALRRGNQLIVIEPDDQYYSACLGLPRVAYVWLDANPPPHAAMDLTYFGILITAQQFAELPALRPEFERRLRDWGLHSGDPIATGVIAPSEDSIGPLLRDHPDADFFLPASMALRDEGVHQPWPSDGERSFLLSRR